MSLSLQETLRRIPRDPQFYLSFYMNVRGSQCPSIQELVNNSTSIRWETRKQLKEQN